MRGSGQLRNCHPRILLAWSFLWSSVVQKGKCISSPACSVSFFFLCPVGGYRIQGDLAFLVHPDALKQMLRRMMERVFSQDTHPVVAQLCRVLKSGRIFRIPLLEMNL